MGLDQAILAFFTQPESSFLYEIAIALAALGSFFQAPVYIVTLYLLGKIRKSILLTVGTGLSAVSAYIIKNLVARPRPAVDATAVTSGSMPSGHAVFAFMAATVISWKLKGTRWWFYLLALIVGISRLVLGVHYPSDVLVGAVIGVLLGELTIRAREFIPPFPEADK